MSLVALTNTLFPRPLSNFIRRLGPVKGPKRQLSWAQLAAETHLVCGKAGEEASSLGCQPSGFSFSLLLILLTLPPPGVSTDLRPLPACRRLDGLEFAGDFLQKVLCSRVLRPWPPSRAPPQGHCGRIRHPPSRVRVQVTPPPGSVVTSQCGGCPRRKSAHSERGWGEV